MREKSFEERLEILKSNYYGNEFDFNVIVNLEIEYEKLTEEQPEHTKRRRELLDMRNRQLCNLRPQRQ